MGKVTLITGATSGMGKATALLLAGKGYDVYAGARNTADGEAVVAEAKGRGIPLKTVQVDVTEAVLRVIEDAGSPIRTPVGVEAETFVPMAKQLQDEVFEAKVKEIFGL